MTSGIENHNESANDATWIRFHCKDFLEKLLGQGYSPQTIPQYKRAIDRFCAEIENRGLCIRKLDGPTTEAIREGVLQSLPDSARTYAHFCLGRFIGHLVDAGVASLLVLPPKEPTAMGNLREEYDAYLRNQRGMSKSTIYSCMRIMVRFMSFRFGEKLGDLNAITPDDIVTFLRQLTDQSQPYRNKGNRAMHLRNLFKFLFWSGKTSRNLANSIPRIAQPPPANLPRYLKPDAIQRLIDEARTNDTIGRRNYAMLLLMARLGLRAPEVIAIRLEDIDWRAGEILIRGKGKLHDRMPLPPDVGEAIVNYIGNGRAGSSRTLFVSDRAPHRAFARAKILNDVLRNVFEKTGLKPPQKYIGSHLLRHSLATDMLRKGASLDEIGDVLRHRSRMTTTIYAKHDIDALRSIARPWPEQGGIQ